MDEATTTVRRARSSSTGTDGGRPDGSDRWPPGELVHPLAVGIGARVAALVSLSAVMWVVRRGDFLGRFVVWDGAWYLWVSREGYPQTLAEESGGSRLGFFPALPALHRLVRTVTGLDERVAAAVLATLLGVAAVVAVWLLAREVADREVADVAALVFAFSPAAYVLGILYTESLLVVLACVALVSLRRERWWLAGAAAAVAGLTRVSGHAVVGTVVVVGLVEVVRHRRAAALWAVGLAPLGFVAWLALLWRRTGDPLAFATVQETFGNEAAFLTPTIRWLGLAVGIGGEGDLRADLTVAGVTVAVAGLALVWCVRRRVPWSWLLYTGLLTVFAFGSEWPHNSLRYLLPAVPVAVALAMVLPRRWVGLWVGVSAACMLALLTVTSIGPGELQAVTP